MFFLLAFLTSLLGIIPLVASIFLDKPKSSYHTDDRNTKIKLAIVLFLLGVLAFTWIYYTDPPALYKPWWGSVSTLVWIAWIASTLGAVTIQDRLGYVIIFPITLTVMFMVTGFVRGSEMMNAAQYSQLLGTVEQRAWTDDIQPKSPEHLRVNSTDNAYYMAQQALGQAGAIGSQFKIVDPMPLQKIDKKFWYIVSLDHQGWSTWRHTRKVPAYIRVSGEDSAMQAELIRFPEGQELVYTPGSCWEFNLERHLWTHGYANTGLMDFTPEIDDNGKFWYVVTTFENAVNGWDGKKVTGVLIVDPVSGDIKPQQLGSIEPWADRVIPAEVLQENLGYRGMYPTGDYWNTVSLLGIGGRKDLTMPEKSNMVFGSDGELYWVTGMTAASTDTSLVGLYYTNTHTGKSTYYEVSGGSTDSAILAAINKHQDVQFRHLHGVTPQIYNIAGVMTAIVPMLNDINAYQGIGFVDVKNVQIMAFGANQIEAYEKYQASLAQSGHQIAPDLTQKVSQLEGKVDRFFAETQNGNTIFYLHIDGVPHIFTTSNASGTLSPKLRLTHIGDHVTISYIASGTDVESLREFENLSLPLQSTAAQSNVREQAKTNTEQVVNRSQAQTIRENLRQMSDEELIKQFHSSGRPPAEK